MSESKHTPGPWVAEDGVNTGRRVVAPNAPKTRRVVAACGGMNRDGNANLIAAAPDLAADGKFLLDRLSDFESEISDEQAREWFGHVQPAIARFRAAIAKAEGRA